MADRDHDDRWDELALGHVLGGLADPDASEFRGHLAGCAQCRARVAELRSMASDLAAAERDERATQRLRTQTESRRVAESRERHVGDDDAPDLRRRALVAGVGVVLLVLVLALWNAHLRSQNAMLRDVASSHARTLTSIGAGTVVPAQTSGRVTGVVSVDGDRVAWSLAGLPQLAAGERLVLWVETDGEVEDVRTYTPAQLAAEDGRLASTVTAAGASRFLVTVESVVVPGQPVGEPVVEADLNVARTAA